MEPEALRKETATVLESQEPLETSSPDHTCQMEVVMKNYITPIKGIVSTYTDAIPQKALFGATVLLWKCVVCSKTRQEEVLGTDENQLDNLLEKAEQYGPQYIQKEGVTFVVAKYQSQVSQVSVPVR